MKMEVQIISKQNIKPSSPTPPHLKIYKFSLLDQLIPSTYAPLVLFFPMNKTPKTNLAPLNLLKTSLSQTLTKFYPLAGKIKDEFSIDCNDEGACFIEAKVNCSLNVFLVKPDLLFINKLLPCEFSLNGSIPGSYVANVQINVFKCGGIAIGICISHKILDGFALSKFINGWSCAARVCRNENNPNFIAGSVFPADNLWLRESSNLMWVSLLKKGNCITKRFVFDSSAITKLKDEAILSGLKCPTRVEVVSGFLWKSAMAASAKLHGFQRKSLVTHLVNLRKRMEISNLSENSVGNFLWVAAEKCINDQIQSEPKFGEMVKKVREGISRIDDEFVNQIKGEEGKSLMLKSINEVQELGSKEETDCFGFSSWCNFRHYDCDFGWGKPIWVSSTGLKDSIFMNLIILVDTKLGDGVEAWITIDEEEMSMLERNPDVITLASLDPSPLFSSFSG